MAVSRGGITREQAYKNIHMFDAKDLVHEDRQDLFEFNKPYMHENVPGVKTPLDDVKTFKAATIICVSGCPGLITKDIVEAMFENTDFPCVFPLSNPTSKAECTPHQAYTWSKGKALCATGSQFPEEMVNGKKYIKAQSNNPSSQQFVSPSSQQRHTNARASSSELQQKHSQYSSNQRTTNQQVVAACAFRQDNTR